MEAGSPKPLNSVAPDTFRYILEPNNVQDNCIFCKIARGQIKPGTKSDPTELVFENERLVAFHDINPGANLHLLIIPKEHLKNCWNLTPDLLDEMEEIADRLLGEFYNPIPTTCNGTSTAAGKNNKPTTKFFIRPPLNSVYHVHMHVMILPLTDSICNPRRLGFSSPYFHVTPAELRSTHYHNMAGKDQN